MAIFGSSDQGAKAPAATPRGQVAAGLSIIGTGMVVHGDVETAGVVKIEGTVDGHVTAGQQVLVAKGGQIDGDVDTGEAVVGGVVHGAVRARERLELQPGATIHGDITTKRILVAEGALLNGLVRMGDADAESLPRPSRPVAKPTLPRPSAPIARVAVPPRPSTPE